MIGHTIIWKYCEIFIQSNFRMNMSNHSISNIIIPLITSTGLEAPEAQDQRVQQLMNDLDLPADRANLFEAGWFGGIRIQCLEYIYIYNNMLFENTWVTFQKFVIYEQDIEREHHNLGLSRNGAEFQIGIKSWFLMMISRQPWYCTNFWTHPLDFTY